MRIVLDTNVIVSAVVFGGVPRRVFETCVAGRNRLVLSPEILEEAVAVLGGRKFRFPDEFLRSLREELEAISEIVSPPRRLRVVRRDPDDDRILECALAGRAERIVTGDRHLLELKSYEGIPILTPAVFLEAGTE